MLEFTTTAIVCLTFTLAGLVKGVIGLGLPTVSLAILTIALDLPSAMALLIAPSLFTNVWQAIRGGHLIQLCSEFWHFFLPAIMTIWIGVQLGEKVDVQLLSMLLGLLLISYALYGFFGSRRVFGHNQAQSARGSQTLSILAGGINGLFTGLTGSFVVPGVMYLQSQILSRDQLIQAMGILFTVSTLALGIALMGEQRISTQLAWTSVAAIIPASLGMIIGQRWRQSLSETHFKRVFFLSLLIIGGYIILSSQSFN